MISLKIVQEGWENFTGWLGPVYFENAVSAQPTTPQIANQLSGIVKILEVLPDGSTKAAGVAQSMVEGRNLAYIETPLEVATEEEIAAEKKLDADKANLPPIDQLNTVEELEAIASDKGINGLREIGAQWGVKERSIPKLIKLILEAQEDYKSRLKGGAVIASPPVGEIPGDEDVVAEYGNEEEVTADEPALSPDERDDVE